MDAMRAQLRGLADTAVSTVREMLTGMDVPAGVRLKAALAVLQSVGNAGTGANRRSRPSEDRIRVATAEFY